MDTNSITTVISTLGFPIATAVALFWYICTMTKDLTQAINNNTLVTTRLLEKLDEK